MINLFILFLILYIFIHIIYPTPKQHKFYICPTEYFTETIFIEEKNPMSYTEELSKSYQKLIKFPKESSKIKTMEEEHTSKKKKNNPSTFQLDDIYDSAIKFDNDKDRLGLDICLEKCKGNCVEFGVTGFSFCFQ